MPKGPPLPPAFEKNAPDPIPSTPPPQAQAEDFDAAAEAAIEGFEEPVNSPVIEELLEDPIQEVAPPEEPAKALVDIMAEAAQEAQAETAPVARVDENAHVEINPEARTQRDPRLSGESLNDIKKQQIREIRGSSGPMDCEAYVGRCSKRLEEIEAALATHSMSAIFDDIRQDVLGELKKTLHHYALAGTMPAPDEEPPPPRPVDDKPDFLKEAEAHIDGSDDPSEDYHQPITAE